MKSLRADAYDLVINGVEIGGGSIRIHDRELQSKTLTFGLHQRRGRTSIWLPCSAPSNTEHLHGGIAFGFDRLCAVLNGVNSIRDFIAFPKNNQGAI